MKIKNYISRPTIVNCLMWLLFFAVPIHSNSQTIPEPDFDWCYGLPDATNAASLNRFLAYTHAPILHTASDTDLAHDERHDVPTSINFDGDLISINNWQNSSNGGSITPSVYYSVLWTDSHFIITYSLFFPRDYAQEEVDYEILAPKVGLAFYVICEIAALADRHENDLERIVIIIDRCTGESAAVATNHGNSDIEKCINDDDAIDIPEEIIEIPSNYRSNLQPGRHIQVYVAEGSHALYFARTEANFDNWSGTCTDARNRRTFYPSTMGSSVNSNDGSYTLIDIFDPDPNLGVWINRNIGTLLTQNTSLEDQRFLGDDWKDNAAAAPWNGRLGMNPLGRLKDEIGIICDSSPIDEFAPYGYNPYLCDRYGDDLASTVEVLCNSQESFQVNATDSYNRNLDPNIIYNWVFPDDYLSCNGCTTNDQSVIFSFTDDPPLNTNNIVINVSFESPDCEIFEQAIAIPYQPSSPTFGNPFPSSICNGAISILDLGDFVSYSSGWTFNFSAIEEGNLVNDLGNNELEVFLGSNPDGTFDIRVNATSRCGDTYTQDFELDIVTCTEPVIEEEEEPWFNPFLCDNEYGTNLMSSIAFACGTETDFEVSAVDINGKRLNSAYTYYWNFPSDYLFCDGCSDNNQSVKFSFVDIPPSSMTSIPIEVEFVTPDCGLITQTISIPLTPQGPTIGSLPEQLCRESTIFIELNDYIDFEGWDFTITPCNEGDAAIIQHENNFLEIFVNPFLSVLCLDITAVNDCGIEYDFTHNIVLNECIRTQLPQGSNEISDTQFNSISSSEETIANQNKESRSSTSMNNFNSKESQISIFPNPFESNFSIDFTPQLNESIQTVELLDINGKVVRKLPTNQIGERKSFEIEGLSSGLYLVVIKTNMGLYTRKVTKI